MGSFLSADDVERVYTETIPRLGPWGLALAILGVLALCDSPLAAFSWSLLSRQQAYQIECGPSKLHEGGELALYEGRYPAYHSAIGAYITCPLNSPDISHQAGCIFDVLLHGYLPDPCIDHDVYQSWHRDRVGDLEWRESEQSAQSIATPEILGGAWAPATVHYYHCRYLFNESSRAQSRMSPLVLDTHLDASHMQHWPHIIMNRPGYFPTTSLFAYKHRCIFEICRTGLTKRWHFSRR